MSAYEALRLANIQRNQRFLREIGIDNNSNSANKSNFGNKVAKKEKTDISVPMRRSSRSAVIDLPLDIYKESADVRIVGRKSYLNANKASEAEESSERVSYTGLLASVPPLNAVPSGPNVSCSQCDANVSLLTGPKMLGCKLESFGKLAVITAAATGGVPKFNKFAGALRWLNCVFLWVNIELNETSNGGYNNEFQVQPSEPGGNVETAICRLTWYGSSKMHRDSDITQLILGTQEMDEGETKAETKNKVNAAKSSSFPVLLFARLVGENYVSCGRVVCDRCDEVKQRGGETVLKFTLRLAQYGDIVSRSHCVDAEGTESALQEIINVSTANAKS